MERTHKRRPSIPLSAIDGMQSTKKWSHDKMVSLAGDWENGVNCREMARRHGVPELVVRNKLSYMRRLACLDEDGVKKRKKPAKRQTKQQDEHPLAGTRKCITCRKNFHSQHIRNNQICSPCIAKQETEDGNYECHVFHAPNDFVTAKDFGAIIDEFESESITEEPWFK
ncbi:hypothetical protein CL630_04020 [bacterium]|nr:hypothetical protein [bacterium]|tara:strand:+ start:84707 stop:85213 length:507 start_codon:yes stop_codon:yes gene_type:complete